MVTRADIILIKRAARRAYLRKGDKVSAEIIAHQIDGLTGWSKRSLGKYWTNCPWCGIKLFDDHVCDKKPETIR